MRQFRGVDGEIHELGSATGFGGRLGILMTDLAPRGFTASGGWLPRMVLRVLEELGFRRDPDAWSLFLPDFGAPQQGESQLMAFEAMAPTRGCAAMAVRGAGVFGDRRSLWANWVERWGREQALRDLPETYLLQREADRERLAAELQPGQPYILKGPGHLRRGLKRSSSRDEILAAAADGYRVAQPVIDGYRIQGRRFSMRVFLLVVADARSVEFLLHPRGWLHYTLADGEEVAEDDQMWIDVAMPIVRFSPATDPELRKTLPFTVDELWSHLERSGHDIEAVQRRIREMLVRLARTAALYLGPREPRSPHRMFRIFGLDLLLDPELHPYLIEANYGPGLDPKLGEAEGDTRYRVTRDALTAVGFTDDGTHGYQRLWRLEDARPEPAHGFELQGEGDALHLTPPSSEERERGADEADGEAEPVPLNATGALIWRLCHAGATVGEMIDALAEHFGTERDEVAADVVYFLRQLRGAEAVRV